MLAEKRSVVRDILSIYVPAFFLQTGLSIVSPILPLYAESFGVSYTLVSFVVAIYAVGRLIADLPVGMLGDKIGRKPVLLVGVLTITATAFLCAFASSFWELLLYRLLQGVGSAMWQTMRTTMLQDLLKPEERGRILGYFQAFTLIGSSAGPSVGGIVAEYWGITAPFYAYGLGSLVCLILSYFLIAEPKTARTHSANNNGGSFSWDIVKRLMTNTGYFIACFATLIAFLTRQALRNTLIPLYGNQELKLDSAEIGYVSSLATLANLLITVPIGYALDKFGRKTVLVPSLALAAITSGIFSLTGDFVQLALACILLGLSQGVGGQAPLAMASDSTMNEPHGLSMGLFRVFGDVGFIIGPIMVGAITDGYGLKAAFYAMSIVTFAAMIIIQIFARETLPSKKK